MLRRTFALGHLAGVVPARASAEGDDAMLARLRAVAEAYLTARAEPEHISCVSVSIDRPGKAPIAFAVGTVSRDPGAPHATQTALFNIGSITKSFTAAALIQLESEGKLRLDDTLAQWLPQYPAWSAVTIRNLLRMTSGIPTYDAAEAMLTAMGRDPGGRRFSDAVLLGFVDPTYPGAPTPTTGWSYSNSNFILAGMIIEKATGSSYGGEIHRRFIAPLGLADMFYSPDVYPAPIRARLVAGYFWNNSDDNRPLSGLLGKDMSGQDMSWAAAAGGIVATPSDVTRWVRALYGTSLLSASARSALLSPVSQRTGAPIAATSTDQPLGFGLGIGQVTNPAIGTAWFYQGETLGYRMMYIHTAADGIIVTAGVNSQPPDSENRLGRLLADLHAALTR